MAWNRLLFLGLSFRTSSLVGEKFYDGNYVICRALCDINPFRCWDLHNEGVHRTEFIEAYRALKESRIAGKKDITVAQVIEYSKKKGYFNHEAIRAQGINSIQPIEDCIDIGARLFFRKRGGAYYDFFPAIQLCLINKKSLGLRNFRIVHPDCYVAEYPDEYVF